MYEGLRFEIIRPEADEAFFGLRVWSGAVLLVTATGFSDEHAASMFGTSHLLSMMEHATRQEERKKRRLALALAIVNGQA